MAYKSISQNLKTRRRIWEGVTTCIGLMMLVVSRPTHAQLRFPVPSGHTDVRQYKRFEQCLAGIGRILGESRTPKWAQSLVDTSPLKSDILVQPQVIPDTVVQIATRCTQLTDVESVSLDDWEPYIHLLLLANRDSDVSVIMKRKLAQITKSIDSIRVSDLNNTEWVQIQGLLDSSRKVSPFELVSNAMIQMYMMAKPPRFKHVRALMQENLDSALVKGRLSLARIDYLPLFDSLTKMGEAEIRQWAREQILSTGNETPEEDRSKKAYVDHLPMLFSAQNQKIWPEVLDSLRKNTEAYASLEGKIWRGVWGEQANDGPVQGQIPFGLKANPLTGDRWFLQNGGEATQAPVRPLPGKINLILFKYPAADYWVDASRRAQTLTIQQGAILRRLKAMFPDLVITTVLQTQGTLGNATRPDSVEEATLLRRYIQEFHQYPTDVTVSYRSWWKLPGRDMRRINRETENERAYLMNNFVRFPPTLELYIRAIRARDVQRLDNAFFLIDQQGAIVQSLNFHRANEATLTDLIRVLNERGQ